MDNQEVLATLGTQDTGQRKKKQNKKQKQHNTTQHNTTQKTKTMNNMDPIHTLNWIMPIHICCCYC